jgi:hypothetical protein
MARPQFKFDEAKFKDLMLYVSEKMSDDPTFGETKLNKALFFCDFEAFRILGKPITGAEYQKNLYGPTARRYPIMRDDLLGTQQLKVERKLVIDHVQDVLSPDRVVANMSDFSDAERTIIDEVIAALRKYTNTEISDKSHEKAAGWRAMPMGETIPYSSAIIDPDPLAPEQLDKLREIVGSR